MHCQIFSEYTKCFRVCREFRVFSGIFGMIILICIQIPDTKWYQLKELLIGHVIKPGDLRQLLEVVVPGRHLEKLFILFGNPIPFDNKDISDLDSGVFVDEVTFVGKWSLNNMMSFLSQLARFNILDLQCADSVDVDCDVSSHHHLVLYHGKH